MHCYSEPRPAPGRGRLASWLVPLALLLLLLAGGALRSYGQATIARAEYFLDTDPGLGAATAFVLPGAPAADLPSLSATVSLSSLAAGFHQLGVRSQDANGAWSLTNRRTFYYEPAALSALPNVTKVEYFIDTDPGFGSATDVPVTAAPDLGGVAFAVPLGSLAAGFHQLGVRSRDANGQWSLTNRRTFYYEPAALNALPNITKVEYFIDTDPGFGAAVDVPVTAATDISGVAFTVSLGSLGTGFHTLSVRSRDANGKWSLTNIRSFYYEPNATAAAPNVVKLEYFLDTDPGFGNGTDVPVTAAPDISNVALTVPLGSLSPGFHALSVRSKDANGKWSLTNVRSFYYEPALAAAPNVTKIEYYFDTDPGFGSATDVPVPTPAPDLANFSFVADASGLADGAHRVFFRSRDANGKWSLASSRSFVKNGCASSANLAAGLASASYSQGGSVGGPVEAAFNTDPAAPTTGNSPYLYNGGVIQADLGANQTISEVRYKLTPGSASSFTVQLQTAASTAGPFTTVDTYTTSLATTTAVTRTLATPATARVLRLAVQNAAGQYLIVSGAGAYNFNCAGPSITSFTPTGGAAGTSVVISGTNLTGATAVTFNGTSAPGFVVNSGTQITVSAPAGGSTGQICVTTPGGTACSSTNYTYPPTIATGTVSPTAFCSSTFISVPFTTNTGAYNAGNQFKFQLSDANGVFTAGSRLYGSLSSQSASGGVLTDSVAFRTPAGSGYRVRVVASSPAITGTDNGTNLTIYPTPVATASSNSPVVFNGTIQLAAQPTGQAGYAWYVAYTAGGTAFVGNGQTLNLPNAQPSQSGKYFVYVTNSNGCQDSASVRVLVQPNAVPVLAMSQFGYTGCAGAAFNIGFSVTGNSFAAGNVITAQLSDASGSFASPTAIGSVNFSGQGSGAVATTVPTTTPTGTGYRIRLVGSNPSVISTTDNGANLGITTQPTATPGSNSPVAYGGTIQLTAATVAGASYFWSGPGFSSNQQNPTIANATPANSGTYTLYITAGGCQSAGAGVAVTVQPSAQPILSMAQFGGSACAGSQLSIGFAVTGNSFNSGNTITAQLSDASGSFAAPVAIGSVSFSGQGNGAVTATIPANAAQGSGYRIRLVGDSPAVTSTTDNGSNLTINTLPTAAIASNNSPVASGGTVTLTAQAVSGATYAWNIPGFGTVSSGSSPTLNFSNASAANSGTYTLFVTVGACTSQTTTTVTVGAAPAVVLATGPVGGTFCPGSGLSVPYAVTSGSVSGGNVFTVQLSDAGGSFAAPVSIGSLASVAGSGSVAAVVPLGTPAGSGYRVRVVASSPATVGSDNGSNLTVGPLTYTWTGAASTDWFNAANWSCGQVPTASSVVLIPTGLGAYPVVGSGTALALNLTVQTGASLTLSGTAGFSLYGNVVYNGTCFATRTSTWTFAGSGTQTVSGSAPVQFGNVVINAGATVQATNVLCVYGSWTNNGSFLNGGSAYGVVFNGPSGFTQVIGGSSVTTFYNVTIDPTTTVSLGLNTVFAGNLVVNGGFSAGSYAVVFSGTAAQTIGGTGSSTFYSVTITNTVGLTLVSNITVLGNWVNNGLFFGGSYSVVFGGTAAQLIGGTQVTNFYNVTFQNPVSVTLTQNIYVLGSFVNTGVFYGYQTVGSVTTGYFVRFGGTVAQVINANATTYFYHFYVDNAAGVSLAANIYIAGNYYLYSGSFAPGTYTVYFNGFEGPAVVQTVGGYTGLSFYGWNIGSGAYVRLLQNVTWLGNFVNAGTFYGYNLVGGVYTGYVAVFGGSGAQVISGSGVFEFWHITWNNLAGITLQQNIRVWGNWLHNGGYIANGYLVDFVGNAAQLIGGSVTTVFHHVSISNLVSVSLSQPVTVLGNWGGAGVFLGNGYLVYFNGTAAQTLTAGPSTRFHDLRFSNPSSVTLLSNIYLLGNWTHNGGFVANGYTVFFSGTALQLIGGTVGTVFHHFTIASGATVQQNLGIALLGDWTNNGTFLHNSLLVYFNGTVLQTIGGTALTTFYDVTLNNAVNVSLAQHIDVLRNFLNLGRYCGCGFRTRFSGTVAQTVGGSGSTHFHDVTFANAAGITLLNGIFVSGLWVNNGGFAHGNQLVTFDGTAAQTIGGTVGTAFWHWLNTNASPAGLSLLRDVTYLGNWTNNGRYCGCGFLSLFAGTATQTLTCTTGTSNFHHLTLANTSAGGVVLVGNINVTGNWLQSGAWFPQTYTVFFTGTAGQSIAVGGGLTLAQFSGLTIANTSAAGVSLTCGLGLSGNFTNNGVFACGLNTVFANGTALQTFGGTAPTTFYNWTIQNPAGASCTGTGGTASTPALGLLHVLTLATGGGNLACNGNLMLISNASGTAMVVNQPGGGVCTGRATMERFITGLSGAAGYRHYSSPMQLSAGAISTTVQEFADDLPVFELNPAYNTVGNSATPFPTLFQYDETRLTAAAPGFDAGWMVPTSTQDLQPLRGYTAQTLPTTTVDIAGLLQNGPVSYSLTRGSLANSGWHLLGNPYPAPLDWDVVRTTSGMLSGVADALYVFQPSGPYTGTYQSYVNGFGQNGGGPSVAAMQGFFVRATAPTATVSLTNAVRATSYASPVFNRGTATGAPRPALRLLARNPANGTADETVLYFEAGAGLGFSPQHDAYKVQLNGAGRPSLWSVAGPDGLAINGLPDLATAPVIPLGVRVSQDGAHELHLADLADAPAGTEVWLEDRALNRRQNLTASPTYAFTMAASYTGQRFYLSFVAAGPLATAPTQLTARTALYPNPTTGTATLELTGLREQGAIAVDVLNVLGQPVQQHTVRPRQGQLTHQLDLRALPTGVYTVRLHAQEGTVIKRLVKE